jgi:hypothetical protein
MHAKLGIVNHHTSIATHQPRNQIPDLVMVNIAETQTTVTPSGATLLTQKSDSNTVIQKSHVMQPLVQVKKTSQEPKKVENTEVLKEKRKKERHA